ncbi:MAG: Calx-beta domain-containing protein, partial [Verrucomicrobiota bacterium]
MRLQPIISILLFCFTFTAGAQTKALFQFDPSGNLTNAQSSSGTALGTFSSFVTLSREVGQPISLAAVVTNGTGPITYQWRLNGNAISGATNATFQRGSAALTDAGTYSVVISNGSGSITNSSASLVMIASASDLYGITYGLSKFIAVGAGGTILTSTDQQSWAAVSSGTTNDLESVTFGNNLFVAVGKKGTILSSSDGTNWTARTSGTANTLKAVTYGGGKFVAVGDYSTVVRSTDAVSWTLNTFGAQSLEGIVYGANTYVIVGEGGTIWTSGNAVSWTIQTSSTLRTLKGVSFANNQFVGVGANGIVLTSSNAIDWTIRREAGNQTLEGAVHYGGLWYAFGPGQAHLISQNGTTWEEARSSIAKTIFSTAVGPTNVVAVGRNALITNFPVFQVDHFEWDPIPVQQRVGQSFAVKITAKDAANITVTNFVGTVSLTGKMAGAISTNTILGSVSHSGILSGESTNYTVGYSFTPNETLQVTHLRHYAGSKISLWTDTGMVLASMNVTSTPGTWIETALLAPLILDAGITYRIGMLVPLANTYHELTHVPTFSDGTIDQSFFKSGDNFPVTTISARWFMVDMRFTVQRKNQSVPVSPTVSSSFTSGVWNGTVTAQGVGTNVILTATDSLGHFGQSNPFEALQTNDLALYITASPDPVAMNNNLTYTITVRNSGTNSSTGVIVTNVLPANVSYVNATSSQGTCTYANGKVTCNVGTLSSGNSATVSVIVTPTVAGVLIVNTATTGRIEAEANIANNSATISTFVPPNLLFGNVVVGEGNIGSQTRYLPFTNSPAIPLSVRFNLKTTNGTASAGFDYAAMDDTILIFPGVSTGQVAITIVGDTIPEVNETFSFLFSQVTNAIPVNTQISATITNDDALLSQVNFFSWSSITSPKRVNTAFNASATARDYLGNAVTSFSGQAQLSAVNFNSSTNTLLTNQVPEFTDNLGNFTLGYSFQPTNRLIVTHVRHFAGSKVSIWTDSGYLLASETVQSLPEIWLETALQSPVIFEPGQIYRIGVLTGSKPYYWRYDGAFTFQDGELMQSYYASGDAFPTEADPTRWYFVDLKYGKPTASSPVTFSSGSWSGNITMSPSSDDWHLFIDDQNGHYGLSSRFAVYDSDDLATLVTYSPSSPTVGSNLVYTVYAMNPGPNVSSNVVLTNILATDVTFVSATVNQGTSSHNNGVVTCNFGNVAALSAATVIITVTPTVAGAYLTNQVTVARTQAESNLANNSASVILIANLPLAVQLVEGLNSTNVLWRSGGQALWSVQTNTTHDSVSAGQSGLIGHNQQTWVETTVRGPGSLSFWWKV